MFGLPKHLTVLGANFEETVRYLAETGEYGPVDDIDAFVSERVEQALAFKPHYMERLRANGHTISVEGSLLRQGGWVTVYTDITAIRQQEELLRGHSAQLSDQLLTHAELLARSNRELAATNAALEAAKRNLTDSEALTRMTTEMVPAHIAHLDPDRIYTYSNHNLPSILPGLPVDIVGLSRADRGSCAKKEQLHATPFLACSGGGLIVTGLRPPAPMRPKTLPESQASTRF